VEGGGGKVPEWDEDIYDALIKLGYRKEDAKQAVKKISRETKNVNDRLKEALNNIK
jgi:Holliday junction resolvasome RuvABC DNA-binding subunit